MHPADVLRFPRKVRSFVRREGRLTPAQERALDAHWAQYGLQAPQAPLDLQQVFGRAAPVTLEIGFGNGDHLGQLAAQTPERNFIGVEVHRPGVGRLLAHAAAEQLTNLRVARHDAVEVLQDWLAPASLDEILVYFPDPWPKTRHHKRRLIQPAFAALAAARLQAGGKLRLATDWAPYAEHMLAVLDAEPLLCNEAGVGRFLPRPVSRPVTHFEARGTRLGHAVFDLGYRRVG